MLKCIRCGDRALDTLCPACASMIIPAAHPAANTIEDAKEAAIRADERRRVIAEVRQLINDRMGKLSICGPNSPQRPIHQGGIVALAAVMAKLEKAEADAS